MGEVDDRADDDDRGGCELGGFDLVQDGADGADELGLVGGGAPADEGDRGCGGEFELGEDVGEVVDAHVDDDGFGALTDRAPVEVGAIFFAGFVSGDEGDAGAVVAVGEGDACVGGGSDAGGDAGDDFDGDACLGEVLEFFAAASEDEGVAAFESDDVLVLVGFLDEELGGVFLFEGVLAFAFSGVDFFGGGVDHGEDGGAD